MLDVVLSPEGIRVTAFAPTFWIPRFFFSGKDAQAFLGFVFCRLGFSWGLLLDGGLFSGEVVVPSPILFNI